MFLTTRPAIRLLAWLTLLLTGVLALQLAAARPAQALGPGRVCVFYYPYGAGFIGHTGWAFSVPGTPTWIYGSADGSEGGNYPHGFDRAPILRGVWVMSTDNGFNDAASTFRARGYTAYTCKNTPASAVGAAQDRATQDRTYTWQDRNCARHADEILSAYHSGTFREHYGSRTMVPLDWFQSLQGTSGQGFDAVRPLYKPADSVNGLVRTDDLAMRDAGARGPVTWDSPVVRRTARGTQLVVVCWMSGPSVTATWDDGITYSTTVWSAVIDENSSSLATGRRYAVSDAWLDTGADTARLVPRC